MIWDFATGQDYVRIEAVKGNKVIGLIAEIPLTCSEAEKIAETICLAHNRGVCRPRQEG